MSTFKNVRVQIATDAEFTDVVYDSGFADYQDTAQTQGQAQIMTLDKPVTGQHVRIWQRGHYIESTSSSWKGMSNKARFREIEVMASATEDEAAALTARNIAAGKIPYVWGLAPTNIAAISDGDWDNFFYGGQPRYEDSRLVSADKPGELVYKAAGLKEVRLTAYYRTVAGQKTLNGVNVVAGHAGGAVGSRHGSGPGHGPEGRLPARSRSLRGGSRGVASGQVLLMARPPRWVASGAPHGPNVAVSGSQLSLVGDSSYGTINLKIIRQIRGKMVRVHPHRMTERKKGSHGVFSVVDE